MNPTLLEEIGVSLLIDWLIDWLDSVIRRIGNISAIIRRRMFIKHVNNKC